MLKSTCVAATKKIFYLQINVLYATAGENLSSVFMTRSNTNRTVQPHQMTSALKLRIKEVNEFYYPCSESKGPDLLHDYCTADLCLYKTDDVAITNINDLSNLCTFFRQKKGGLIFLTC